MSHGRHISNMKDTIIDNRFLDLPKRGSNGFLFYSSSGSDRHRGHHNYYPDRRSERGYLPDEFKKSKTPTFDGELNKYKDTEACLFGMNKFFESYDFIEKMKVRIDILSLKREVEIWRDYVKNIREIMRKDLIWHEFRRIFMKKYMSQR